MRARYRGHRRRRRCPTAGATEVIVVEAGRAPGDGALPLTGRQGPVMQESARTALSWLRANAARFGLDPDFHCHDIHLHVQAGDVPKEGSGAPASTTTRSSPAASP